MSFFDVEEARPKLSPPIKSWREDMPENREPQLVPPQLRWLTVQNDIYLEVPRYRTEIAWGGMIFSTIISFGVMIFFYCINIFSRFLYFLHCRYYWCYGFFNLYTILFENIFYNSSRSANSAEQKTSEDLHF